MDYEEFDVLMDLLTRSLSVKDVNDILERALNDPRLSEEQLEEIRSHSCKTG